MPTPHNPLAHARLLAFAQDGALTRQQALRAGLTPSQLRGLVRRGQWRNPFRGGFVLADARDMARALARCGVLTTPAAAVCASTAARLHGLEGLVAYRPEEPVHLLIPAHRARDQRRGLVLHWSSIEPSDVVDLDGIPATTIHRTLRDLVPATDRPTAVSLLDSALHAGLVTSNDLEELRLGTRGRRGHLRSSPWWGLADGRSESPLETRLRLLLFDAGIEPEELQWDVRTPDGYLTARLDFAWPSIQLAVEADGTGPHDTPAALYRDRRRQNALMALGWTVLRFTWADVTGRQAYVAAVTGHHVANANRP